MTLETALPPTIDRLREMYRSNKIYQAIFDWFAARRRDRKVSSVQRLEGFLRVAGFPESRRFVITFLRDLQAAHCGRFIMGRRGRVSRFKWATSMASVGRAACGQQDWITALVTAPIEPKPSPIQSGCPVVYRLNFGPSRFAVVSVPPGLSDDEAIKLAEYVTTLSRPTSHA